VKQRVKQIAGEPDRDEQADERFSHDALLKPVALAGVERGQKEEPKAKGKKDDVEHCVSPGFDRKIGADASVFDTNCPLRA
jgi:hypothetical protein